MNEYRDGVLGTLGLLAVVVYSLFWWLGGRDKRFIFSPRVWRRWVAPIFLPGAILALACVHGSFSWWHLGAFPAQKLLAHIGYGADKTIFKLLRRALWALFASLANLPYAFASGHWVLFFLQMLIAFEASMLLGVFNEVKAAREEAAIVGASQILSPFIAF